ncbi:hypothetical protein YC2023_118735 [Brassica napus]
MSCVHQVFDLMRNHRMKLFKDITDHEAQRQSWLRRKRSLLSGKRKPEEEQIRAHSFLKPFDILAILRITVEGDLTDQLIRGTAKKTEGFSGREIAKPCGWCSSGSVWYTSTRSE